jgi:hypothetical protein
MKVSHSKSLLKTIRHFSTSGGYLRSSPLTGGSMLNDDEFLPDLEKRELDHQQRMESILNVQKKPDNMLRHGEEHGGVLYKYDLPVVN